jgi:hypothetical protein
LNWNIWNQVLVHYGAVFDGVRFTFSVVFFGRYLEMGLWVLNPTEELASTRKGAPSLCLELRFNFGLCSAPQRRPIIIIVESTNCCLLAATLRALYLESSNSNLVQQLTLSATGFFLLSLSFESSHTACACPAGCWLLQSQLVQCALRLRLPNRRSLRSLGQLLSSA